MELGLREESNSDTSVYSRKVKWQSRPPITQVCGSKQLEIKTKIFQGDRGPHHMDMFARKDNTQLPRFYSWKPEPEAEGVDAFQQSWKNIRGWINPPFNMIGRILIKVRQEKAHVTIVAPIWPTAPWFPWLLKLSIEQPILLPEVKKVLLPDKEEKHYMSNNPSWQLAVFNICSQQVFTRESLVEPCRSSQGRKWTHELQQHISQPGRDLQAGSMNKVSQIQWFHQIEW